MTDARAEMLSSLSSQVEAVGREGADAILRLLPGYRAVGDELRPAIAAVVKRSFATLIDLWHGSRPLTAQETATLVAIGLPPERYGISLEETLHAHRIAAEVIWKRYSAAALACRDLDRGVLLEAAAIGYEYLNAVSAGITRRFVNFERERQEWRAETEHSLVEHLVSAPPRLEPAVRSARALGVQLTGRWQAVVVEANGSDAGAPRLEASAIRHRLQVEGYPTLVAPTASRVVVLRMLPRPEPVPALTAAVTGVGHLVAGATAVHYSYEAALEALDIARRRGTAVLDVNDALLERFLLGLVSPRELADVLLAPLSELPDNKRETAEATLAAYLDANASVTAASRILYLQPQSVRYRLRKLERLVPDLHDPDRQLLLHVAIKRARLPGGEGRRAHPLEEPLGHRADADRDPAAGQRSAHALAARRHGRERTS